MQTNRFLLLKKLKNTSSAQLCSKGWSKFPREGEKKTKFCGQSSRRRVDAREIFGRAAAEGRGFVNPNLASEGTEESQPGS